MTGDRGPAARSQADLDDGSGDRLLSVEGLRVQFRSTDRTVSVLHGVDFHVNRGEIVCIIGESGSGKTISALSTMGLLPQGAAIAGGRIAFGDRVLAGAGATGYGGIRGARIGMIFQEPMSSLNPTLRVGEQVAESLVRHKGMSWREATAAAIATLEHVGIPDAPRRARQYIHQLSGGMRQRVMIASAISTAPELLVADEPTTALDVTIQAQVLDLIRKLRDENGMGVLFITHDLGVVAEIADRVYVMYSGRIVESGSVKEVINNPLMPYTSGLLRALPDEDAAPRALYAIPGSVPDIASPPPGCAFGPRCEHFRELCSQTLPALEQADGLHRVRCMRWREIRSLAAEAPADAAKVAPGADRSSDVLLVVRNLTKSYPLGLSLARSAKLVKAVDGVSFHVNRGEIVAVVGESGSGKTTVGRCVLRLIEPTSGTVQFDGTDLGTQNAKQLRALRRDIQIVFQDPFASLNPRMRVGEMLAEPLQAHALAKGPELQARVLHLLSLVGLGPDALRRYPAAFSGGQRQRLAIARALALDPKLIVADEAVSALDVSIRAQITNLLEQLSRDLGISILFIAHDLALVRNMARRVIVMYLGKIMEQGPVETVFSSPRHPYTQALLSSTPSVHPARRERIVLTGDVPSPLDPPSGCVFRTRCPRATAACAVEAPKPVSFGPEWEAACIHPLSHRPEQAAAEG